MNKIYLIIAGALLGMSLQSCILEDKPLFDKSPAERMEEYLSEFSTLLESSEDGWLLEYYAEAEQSYGGYAYILKFDEGKVTAYFQLAEELEKTETSLYKLVTDDGPVLTFDTYNKYIHFFATPDIYDYEALQGDYEFRIIDKNESETEILLQGKRTNNHMKLRKFDGDPVKYLARSLEVEAGAAAPVYSIEVGDIKGECALAGNVMQFRYLPAGTEIPVTGRKAFCYTDTGIRLYEPMELEGIELYEFTFGADAEAMISEDGKVKISNIYLPLSELVTFGDWFISRDNLGKYAYGKMMEANDGILDIFGGFQAIILGDYFGYGWGLNVLVNAEYLGIYGMDIKAVADDKITVLYNADENTANADVFLEYGAAPLLQPFGVTRPKTFTLRADDEKNPTWILLTDDSNPDNTIKMTRDVVLF